MTNSAGNGGDLERLGGLLRFYRTDFGGGRGLSQNGLLALMAERKAEYAALDRSAISRWENGARRPPRDFLADFAQSLRLSRAELDALMNLAGYAESAAAERAETLSGVRGIAAKTDGIDRKTDDIRRGVRFLVDSAAAEPPMDAAALAKDALRRAAPPGIYAAAVGWVLNALGQNGTWALMAYVAVALAIVVGQGVLRRRRADDAGELFFVSVFFALGAPLLQTAVTGLDTYGFFALWDWADTSIPLLMALMANLALALAASVAFGALRSRRYGRDGAGGAFARAAWTTLPPCLFVYANILLFANVGAWIFFLITLGVIFGAFTAILAFGDRRVALSDWEAKMALVAAVAVIILLCAVGAAGTLVTYIDPSPIAIPDHNLLWSWEINWERLGYPQSEWIERARLGFLWMAVSAIAYLATALGGYLVVSIRRQAAAHRGASGESEG